MLKHLELAKSIILNTSQRKTRAIIYIFFQGSEFKKMLMELWQA